MEQKLRIQIGKIFVSNYIQIFVLLLRKGQTWLALATFCQNGILQVTSLLPWLQAQTLPDATPPIGQINPFNKMAITSEPLILMPFGI